jgi:hypothetical protein
MMTREDMMRELELLPVWQLRASAIGTELKDIDRVSTQQDAGLSQHLVSKQNAPQVNIGAQAPDPEQSRDIQVKLEVETPKDSLENIEEPSEISRLVAIESPTFTHVASEDSEYLFVLPSAAMSLEELRLFQNICKALRIKTKPSETSSDILALITDVQPKLLLVMGETTSRSVLQSSEPIVSLRDKPHQLQGIALIATYGLSHLLQNPADKAKVWRDLCIGLQILQDLKV